MEGSRRVKMTKRLIRESFLELLEKEPIGKITVTQICDLADVNRSTFYAYYDSTYDLLREIEDGVLEKIPAPTKEFTFENRKEFAGELTAFFEYIKKHSATFAVLISNTDESDFNYRLLEALFDKMIIKDIIDKSFYSRLGYVFSVNGAVGMIKEWIENDFPISAKEFAQMALDMCINANDVAYIKSQGKG